MTSLYKVFSIRIILYVFYILIPFFHKIGKQVSCDISFPFVSSMSLQVFLYLCILYFRIYFQKRGRLVPCDIFFPFVSSLSLPSLSPPPPPSRRSKYSRKRKTARVFIIRYLRIWIIFDSRNSNICLLPSIIFIHENIFEGVVEGCIIPLGNNPLTFFLENYSIHFCKFSFFSSLANTCSVVPIFSWKQWKKIYHINV